MHAQLSIQKRNGAQQHSIHATFSVQFDKRRCPEYVWVACELEATCILLVHRNYLVPLLDWSLQCPE